MTFQLHRNLPSDTFPVKPRSWGLHAGKTMARDREFKTCCPQNRCELVSLSDQLPAFILLGMQDINMGCPIDLVCNKCALVVLCTVYVLRP